MANIKDLKKKIKSTKSTLKITMAMKLVSAAKLAKVQSAIVDSLKYSNELKETIQIVSALNDEYENEYLKKNEGDERVLALVFSSDRGLCGGYNSGLVKKCLEVQAQYGKDSIKFDVVGKKAKELLAGKVNIGKLHVFETAEAQTNDIYALAEEIGGMYASGEYTKIVLIYNVFHSVIKVVPTSEQILPMTLEEEEIAKIKEDFPYDFKYRPGPDEILDGLIPEAFSTGIFTKFLSAKASEHAMRMTSMDNASKNCKEVIRKVTLKMNKLRQAAITTELIEVVSGAESLKG